MTDSLKSSFGNPQKKKERQGESTREREKEKETKKNSRDRGHIKAEMLKKRGDNSSRLAPPSQREFNK